MPDKWVRKRPHWWQYYLVDQERPFADVLRHREDGPEGALWDALPTGSFAPLVECVTLDEAKAAVERQALQMEK